MSLTIRSRRCVLPGGVRPASIHVRDGVIVDVAEHSVASPGRQIVDAGDLVVAPGLIDTHVHVNEPGRTEWEGFDTATRAAAAGGVTTIVDMPLNSIPATTTVAGLEAKRAAAAGRCWVDVGFWGGVVPGNRDDLAPLADAGVLGFKCFLVPSGVDEFQHVGEADLGAAAAVLAELGLPLLVHAELPAALKSIDPSADARRYVTWLDSRPPECETDAVAMVIDVVRRTGAWMHIVHLAAAPAMALLREARRDRLDLTVETCPHYLIFAADEIRDGETPLKCAPPIRDQHNRDLLWRGLLEGDIDLVATDHSPAPPELKQIETGDFVRAWGGIASLQLGLAAMWTAASRRGIGVDRLSEWMSAAPARLAGLDRTKGRIAPGFDADLVVWDPEAEWMVEPARLYHRHPVTPYAGRHLRGRVVETFLRGEEIFNGTVLEPARGRLLARTS